MSLVDDMADALAWASTCVKTMNTERKQNGKAYLYMTEDTIKKWDDLVRRAREEKDVKAG